MTPAEQHDADQQILALLSDHQRHHITELYRLQLPAEVLNAALKTLIENEKVRQDDGFIMIV
jgi:ATP-dependent DNA helicase RecQ